MQPKKFNRDYVGYRNLALAATLLEIKSPNGFMYIVNDVYFDFGQNWMWTTIIAIKEDGDSYQALNPAEWEKIILAETIDELDEICVEVLNGKYCPDKI